MVKLVAKSQSRFFNWLYNLKNLSLPYEEKKEG